MTDYDKNGAAVGGGFTSPLTTEGDLIIGDATGQPIRLPAGTNGYAMRVAGGRPAWREHSAYGLISARPAATATREDMVYWATDSAAGSELSKCLHKGASTYAWETIPYGTQAQVVGGGLVAILTGSPAGGAVISDGAGDISVTSAGVSAALAASTAAAALAALGGAGVTRFAPALATGQGWTIDGTVAGMTWSYEAGDIARLTYAAGPLTHDLDGPQIERAITFDHGARYRVRVTPRAQTSSAGVRTMAGLYIRNAAGTIARVLWWSGIERVLYTGPWTLNDGGGLDGITNRGADGFALDGTDSMELRWTAEGAFSYVAVGSTGLARVLHTGTLGFVPAAFGLAGATDDAITVGTQDFSGLSVEAFG